MSSTSIARQNRRMRLKQKTDPQTSEGRLTTLSPSELVSDGIFTNSDKDSSTYCDKLSSEFAKAKSLQSSKNESYETLTFASNYNFMNGDISSRPVEKLFIESDRGFKEINASDIFQISHQEISVQNHESELLINLAFKIAKYFHSLSNFCHGVLGGMSLLYILVLLHLFADLLVDEDTINFFSFFSKPIHNVFNFLCIICCISVFDRFDITNTVELFKLIKKLDFRLITLLIYPICLLMSLSTANVDDRLSIPDQNATIWESLNFKEATELYYWKTLSISKCFGALLGWVVICWDQNFNLFFDHMRSILLRRKMPLH